MNITTGANTLIYTEYVGNTGGTYDGSAYDNESENYFFANYDTQDLMYISLTDEGSSEVAGTLEGVAASATFFDGSYYYVDQTANTIKEVTFNEEFLIETETPLSSIPGSVIITDIAMEPSGATLYIIGNVDDGTTELIVWEVATDTYATVALSVDQNTSIAYSPDGNLYAVTSADDSGSGFSIYTIDPNTGVFEAIDSEESDIEDPLSDITRGPIM